jgi:flagella synthesis protein FlgN
MLKNSQKILQHSSLMFMDNQVALCQHKLESQLQQLNDLTLILDAELNALSSRKGDGLKEIAREKLMLLNAIQKLDKELSGFASELFSHEAIIPITKSINEKLLNCKKQNDVNAQAAHQANLAVRELKNILIGAPSSVTYGQDGAVINAEAKLVKNIKA